MTIETSRDSSALTRDYSSSRISKLLATLPVGTVPIALGMIVGALTGYVVVIVVNHAVSGSGYAGFGTFWSLIFVVGPGLFFPLEQEISRAISHRTARDDGSKPIVRMATLMATSLAIIVALILACFSPVFIKYFFHGNVYLQIGFIMGVVGYAFMHCSRGVLSGNHRFKAYGMSTALEGGSRFSIVVVLAIFGVKNVGVYGLALGIAPYLTVAPFIPLLISLMKPGTDASKRELGTALTWLVSSSVLSQALAYSSLFITNIVEGRDNALIARYFTNAFFIARIPVIGFMAFQAALLPKLSALHSLHNHKEFRLQFRKLFLLVIAASILGIGFVAVFGNFAGRLLFGPENFRLAWIDFLVLTIGSCIFLAAQTMQQACIALQHYKVITFAYLTGVAVTGIASFAFAQTSMRTTLWVSIAFSIGCAAVATILFFSYEKHIHKLVNDESLADAH